MLFLNNIKIALRSQKRNKFFSMINIAGLTLGIACCLVIFLYVSQELSYDKFHENAENTFILGIDEKMGDQQSIYYSTQPPLGKTLKAVFPSVENYTRIMKYKGEKIIKIENRKYSVDQVFPTDSTFFDLFSVQFVTGNKTALRTRSSIVLTRSLAERLFKSCDNAMDKLISFNNCNFKVKAIVEDCPHNSHIQFSALYPMENVKWINDDGWDGFSMSTYVRLSPATETKKLEVEINKLVQTALGEDYAAYKDPNYFKFFFTPLTDIHLHTSIGKGSFTYVKIFIIIAIFILLIACINFSNLSTARASKRACEIGIKKALGSSRRQLISQFFTEAIITSLISFALALVLIEICLPLINNLMGIEIQTSFYNNPLVMTAFLGIAILTGLVAGLYSALYLSSFNPIKILKGELTKGKKSSVFRGVLVVFQFTISIFLIISTLVINKQLNYISDKDLGFAKENLLKIEQADKVSNKRAFTQELMNIPAVRSVSFSTALPGDFTDGKVFYKCNSEDKKEYGISLIASDDMYAKTMKYELVEGRFLSNSLASDSSAIVLNETAIKAMGLNNPLESEIRWWNKDLHIVGVVKDFHSASLTRTIQPIGITLYKNWYHHLDKLAIRLEKNYPPKTIANIEKQWKIFSNNTPMNFTYMDNIVEKLHREEHNHFNTFTAFSLLAIFIACIGLLGLVSFTVEQRVKEIGIRKVYGAPIKSILMRLNVNIIKWMALAFCIASPIAYSFMNGWLDGFAYKIEIGFSEFLITGVATLVISLATVSWQITRAAKKNPIDAIKCD